VTLTGKLEPGQTLPVLADMEVQRKATSVRLVQAALTFGAKNTMVKKDANRNRFRRRFMTASAQDFDWECDYNRKKVILFRGFDMK
jgi:hypothetical protein